MQTMDRDEHVFLLGRPPMAEFIGFVEQLAQDRTMDRRQLADAWRRANDRIRGLEEQEAGAADDAVVRNVPDELQAAREAALANPAIQRSFELVPFDVQMVELDRLVVYQKNINLAHVARLGDRLGDNPTPQEVFDFCIPLGNEVPAEVGLRQLSGNDFVFVSPSNDLRVLGIELLAAEQVSAYMPRGSLVGAVAAMVGFSVNGFGVIEVEGRLILNNGSHRAYTLHQSGITSAPCIVQGVTRRDELDAIAGGDVAANKDRYLTDRRPPLLRDYFDAELRKLVAVPRMNFQVHVQVGFEVGQSGAL